MRNKLQTFLTYCCNEDNLREFIERLDNYEKQLKHYYEKDGKIEDKEALIRINNISIFRKILKENIYEEDSEDKDNQ